MEDKIYLALLHTLGFSHRKLHVIFAKEQNYKQFYEQLSRDFLLQHSFSEKFINTILERKNKFNTKFILDNIKKRDVRIITVFDADYPEELLHISQVPFLLYLRGTLDTSQKFSIVGTRKMSSYGRKIIQNIVPDISKYFIIVSGGAAGCDSLAHKVCLESGNKTLSIIGTGIDQDYPTNNKELYDDIVKTGGGILSIFPIGEVGNAYNFPIRNELVAGLSLGTLVVEAQEKSGTIITSNQCLDLGKDLFAVPGDIYLSNSSGCNELIKKGNAKLTTTSLDILEEYNIGLKNNNISSSDKMNVKLNDDIEKNIYNLLLVEKYNINEISKKIGIDVRTLAFKLSMLEIAGIIKKSLSGDYEIQ